MAIPVTKVPLHAPSLQEVAKVLQNGLGKNFGSVSVSVVDCPDLTQKPFNLAAQGLCGNPRLADVGGPPYLLPLVQRDKLYDLGEVARLVELPGAFMVGAGAGPWKVVGVNSELVCNVQVTADSSAGPPLRCNNHVAKVDVQDGSCVLTQLKDTLNFNLMGNFLCCEGKPGKVLEIKASKRTGEENFMSAVRKTLLDQYQNRPVGLGGVFLIEKGKANLHIMPDFSCTPLTCDAEVNDWLKFYEMDATLVCLGEVVSFDPDLDLRVEHFHCFSDHGQGGHYHYDTTPDDVVYRAYFNVAEILYRIDQPPASAEKFGR
ncbi:ester hydrolase C11orf54 homolog [Babylonia areolata]|uniref:ester hydrolase C11orf54 homolog n=1 Tax=Babylonia areolata TaxID=304850 RepID=UPI003FD26EB0